MRPSVVKRDEPLVFRPAVDEPGISQTTTMLVVVLAVAVISLACVSFMPSINDYMVGNTLWNGLADLSRGYPAAAPDNLPQPSAASLGTMLVVPELPPSPADLSGMREFISGGGTLIIADDYGYGNQVLEYLGVTARFSGLTLLDPLFCYKNPAFPRITDFSPEVVGYGVISVVLNNATALTGVNPKDVLAWSSKESILGAGQIPAATKSGGGPYPVAARMTVSSGEVVLLSDPSIFINSMLKMEDNRIFVDYLLSKAAVTGSLHIIETSLNKGAMDYAKAGLARAQEAFKQPVLACVLLAAVFAAVFTGLFRDKITRS